MSGTGKVADFDFSDEATLGDARAWLRERFEDGATCPCCRQFVKLYRRSITGAMARGLIALYRYHAAIGWEAYGHIPTLMHDACPSNMGALLRFWGLIEAAEGVREDGSSRIGWYRMTELGRAFVDGAVRVPRYVYLYNQEPVARPADDAATLSIIEAIGQRFNYAELMGHVSA